MLFLMETNDARLKLGLGKTPKDQMKNNGSAEVMQRKTYCCSNLLAI